jgi:hypothetical protein
MEEFLSKLTAGRWAQQLNRMQALAYGDRRADDGGLGIVNVSKAGSPGLL